VGLFSTFQEVNHGPTPNVSSSSAPQFCGFSIYDYTLKKNDQIRRGNTWGGACFRWSATPSIPRMPILRFSSAYMIRPRTTKFGVVIWERGVLGRQPRHCICTNASRDLSAVADFYRATLCASAVFVVARCPSVRSSITHPLYPDG